MGEGGGRITEGGRVEGRLASMGAGLVMELGPSTGATGMPGAGRTGGGGHFQRFVWSECIRARREKREMAQDQFSIISRWRGELYSAP